MCLGIKGAVLRHGVFLVIPAPEPGSSGLAILLDPASSAG